MKYTLDSQESKELFPGFEAKFIHSDNMTVTFVEIKAGAELPEHSHPHEQITFVREGTLQIIMDNKEYLMDKGELLVIPSNVSHKGLAISDCKVLDVFNPVREDFKQQFS